MVIAVAYSDVKHKETRKEKKGATIIATEFVGGRSTPDLPYAKLSEHSAGWNTSVHYHENDQFQVVIGGNCKLGRHDINAYSVHFSRAYTPYGPLIPNKTGFTFFVLRTCYDLGARNMPESANTLKQVPNRKPWQISRQISMPKLPNGAGSEIALQADPDIKDEQGLATYALSVKANANASGPDPSQGNGQFLLVLKGSVWHENKELKAPTAIFVSPHEGAFQTRAGAEGMEALVLNFPRREQRSASTRTRTQTANGLKTWQCALCEFVYDEATGLPEEGIAPGTRWEDVPETWNCPDCSASKSDFQMVALDLTATDQ